MFTGNENKGVASVPDLEAKNLDPGCGNEEMGVALPAQELGVATEDQGVAPLAQKVNMGVATEKQGMALLTQKVNNGVATDLRHKSDEGVAIVSETWGVATVVEDLGYGKVGVALLAQNKTNGVARDCELGVALIAQSETSGVATSSETRGVAADVEDPGCGKVGVALLAQNGTNGVASESELTWTRVWHYSPKR